jgi:hypothetical protein
MAEKPKKKVVRVQHGAASGSTGATWTPTAEAKGKATMLRVFAWIFWLLALGGEAAAIFWLLKQDPINMTYLIIAIVVIGALALTGSLLWKKANRADPASKAQPFRFFVQNQLGAIITMIAFIPLIVLILLNKDMAKKDKTIASVVAGVIFAAVFAASIDYGPASVEDYTAQNLTCADLPADTPADEIEVCNTDVARVTQLTGTNMVTWTKSGEVYHLCEAASAVNLESQDNQIYTGTVADAIAEGKDRLTLQVDQELSECGLTADAGA